MIRAQNFGLLRDPLACWGISGLTLRELEQIDIGNSLLLRGLWLCVPIALSSGAVILEHPAPPYQADRPSIWRTGIVNLLLREGWLFRRHTFRQWRFGASGNKPTTLLYAHFRVPDALDLYVLDHLSMPEQSLIGRTIDGSFRTAAAKELCILAHFGHCRRQR